MKKNWINVIFILVILGVGILIGANIPKKTITQGVVKDDSFQEGWDAARQRLSQFQMGGIMPPGMEIRSVNGNIQKIDGNAITVKINPLEPLSDPKLDTRTIIVDSKTKISIAVQRDSQQFQKELQEYEEKMRAILDQDAPAEKNLVNPPASFDIKEIALSDLKKDQQISVIANENIKKNS